MLNVDVIIHIEAETYVMEQAATVREARRRPSPTMMLGPEIMRRGRGFDCQNHEDIEGVAELGQKNH